MKIAWIRARNDVGNKALVISLIKKGMASLTRGKRQKEYPFNLDGLHRRKSARGEGVIELALLSTPQAAKKCLLITNGIRKEIEFKVIAAGIGNKRKGNIIADLFGLDQIGSPVAGEVKISDRNPWYAVVECAAQVALLRSDRQNLKECLQKMLGKEVRGRGSWGIVIAPKDYWLKKETKDAKSLVEELRKKTKIRICCVSFIDNSAFQRNPVQFNVEFGQPPSTKKE